MTIPMRRWILAGLVFLCLFPIQFVPTLFPHMDKVGHFAMMFVVTVEISTFLTIRKGVFLAFLIGSVIEYSQHFTARSAALDDMLANTAGILFAWFLLTVFKRK